MKNFYEFLIKKYGGILSDTGLSKSKNGGSYYLYNSLIKKYPSYELVGKKISQIFEMPQTNYLSRILISYKVRTYHEI